MAELVRQIPGYDPFRDAGDCRFDAAAAKKRIAFFCERLVHVRGHLGGEPFIPEPWQQAIIANQYGWIRPDGTRRYREILETYARKNGKTTKAAGSALMEVVEPLEPGSEVYSAAASRDQANLVFSQAKGMVARDEELFAKLIVQHNAIINVEDELTTYKSISADAHTAHGFNPQYCVIDELHTQPKRDLVDALKTGMGARRQPQITYITTAGYDTNSICYEVVEYARKVRDGSIVDPSFLPVIYEVPRDADWSDRSLWVLANPNLGVSVSESFLESEFLKAEKNPAYENTFRRLFLNQWVEQDTRWISVNTWKATGRDYDGKELEGRECFGGLDLSQTRDLTSLALCFPPDDREGNYRLLVWHWICGENIADKEQQDRVPYRTWAEKGLVKITPGPVVDYTVVRDDILKLADKYRINEIAYDPYNATILVGELEKRDGITMALVRQGMITLSPMSKEFERLVLERRLEHNNNPVMLWQIGNAAVKRDDAGNIKPDKTNPRARIDGVVASVMSVGRAIVNVEAGSVYSSREPMVLRW